MESPLGTELGCTKSPKKFFNKIKIKKIYKNILKSIFDSGLRKMREKGLGVAFEEREGKALRLRHPFNLAEASCEV